MATNPNGGATPPPRAQRIRKTIAAGFNNGPVSPLARAGLGMKATTPNQTRPNRPTGTYKDQQYITDLSAADYKRQSAINTIQANRERNRIGYGFDTNPVENPYSQAALLQRNYNRAQKSTLNQMAENGQLYSGAFANARAGNIGTYDQQYNQLRSAYDTDQEKLRTQRSEADQDYRLAVAQAGQAAINRAQKIRPTGQTSAPAKNKKNRSK